MSKENQTHKEEAVSPQLERIADIEDIEVKYTPMDPETSRLFLESTVIELEKGVAGSEEVAKDTVEQVAKEVKGSLLGILLKRVEVFKLEDKVGYVPLLLVTLLSASPGEAILALINLVGEADFRKKKIEGTHGFAEVFPEGLYSTDSALKIIDEYIKPRKVKHSDVYIQRT